MLAFFKIKQIRIFPVIGKFVILPPGPIVKFKIKRLIERYGAVYFKLSVRIAVYGLVLLENGAQPIKPCAFNVDFPNNLFLGRFPVASADIVYNLFSGA